MSRFDNEIRITPSVLDRLLDDRPDQSHEAPASRQTSMRALKQSVKRDLEWLLNTRLNTGEMPEDLPEVLRSVAAFGLPDFADASANVHGGRDQNRLREAIEKAVTTFEPRLEGVEVTLERMSESDRAIRFRIDGRLRVDPAPEPVSFDSMLQLGNGEFLVKGD